MIARLNVVETFQGITWECTRSMTLAEINWLGKLAHKRHKTQEAERKRAEMRRRR